MKNWTTFLLLFLSWNLYGQTSFDPSILSMQTRKIVKAIAKVNMLMGSYVWESGVRPKQYDNFEQLREQATTNELTALTQHPNPSVRCYAFWALAYNPSVDLYPIVLDHISDTVKVYTQFGCIGGEEAVGDFFIELVTPQYVDLRVQKFDSTQLAKLDSVLIYTPNDLYATNSAIRRATASEQLYPKIRELVTQENDQTALILLARYQKEEDIELILQNREKSKSDEGGFFYTYQAISQFPHPAFFPLLEANLQKTLDNTHFSNEWRELYKAIASYKHEKAKALLLVPFTKVEHSNMKAYHLNFVWGAIREFKSPLYDELLWKLWEEEKRITHDVFRYLLAQHPEKVLDLTKENLQNVNQLYEANNSLYHNGRNTLTDLVDTMLTLIMEQDRELGIQIIGKSIREANVHTFPIFSNKATELKDPSLIKPLLDRLETEWNSHIYLKAVKVLLSYQSDEINQRILSARKNNKHLNEGWGGEALDQLLEAHDID